MKLTLMITYSKLALCTHWNFLRGHNNLLILKKPEIFLIRQSIIKSEIIGMRLEVVLLWMTMLWNKIQILKSLWICQIFNNVSKHVPMMQTVMGMNMIIWMRVVKYGLYKLKGMELMTKCVLWKMSPTHCFQCGLESTKLV